MASSYTFPVKDGKITALREYITTCAPAFGVRVIDGVIQYPPPVDEDSCYYVRSLAEHQIELARVCDPDFDVRAAMQKEFDEAHEAWESMRRDNDVSRKRYLDMLDRVDAWTPPAELTDMRTFMREQL